MQSNRRVNGLKDGKDEPLRYQEVALVTFVSLIATWVLFFDYFPPFKRVQLWSDTQGYHWPLLNYAYASLREGRFPLWDPSIYSGIPFAGNIQAGLFYPPNWLLFLGNLHRERIPFQAVEVLAIGHVWVAIVFGYLWLRERCAHWLPAVLGGIAVGCSGYMLSQLTHLGMICGYAWMPFGLWGIQQASDRQDWRPLWKLALGLAMTLLAGYPAMFAASGLLAFAYAIALPGRLRLVWQVPSAAVVSLLLGAVQILPVLDMVSSKAKEILFGAQLPDHPRFYLSFLLPNLYNQNRTGMGPEVAEHDYMYLGALAIFGLLYIFRRPRFQWVLPAASILAVFLFVMENPSGIVSKVVYTFPVLPDALRTYNLISGLPFAGAILAAGAANELLAADSNRSVPAWVVGIWAVASCGWVVFLFYVARRGGPEFASGLESGAYAIVTVALVWAGLLVYRSRRSTILVAILLLVVFAEYRAFGVNRKFNAVTGAYDEQYGADMRDGGKSFLGIDDAVFAYMKQHPDYRIALFTAPFTTDLRHYGLATPQGFDPFVNHYYKGLVERFVKFKDNRHFDMDVYNRAMLNTFGVGFVLAMKHTEEAATLRNSPDYRLLEPSDTFFQIFELRGARPAWRFEAGNARVLAWQPERRVFAVSSETGGTFSLMEQLLPGWTARIDGTDFPVDRWSEAFQAVSVPPGQRRVEFLYRPKSVLLGAAISLLALAAMLWILWRTRSREA